MEIPKQFKKAIDGFFYDKEIRLLKEETSFDDEGGVSTTFIDDITFYGNVNLNINQEIQKEYGLSDDVSVLITTGVLIPTNSYISYKGTIYKVVGVKDRDSHNLIIGANYGD